MFLTAFDGLYEISRTMTMNGKMIASLKALHSDESGDQTIGAIAMGAVGILLAVVMFTTMSGGIKSQGEGVMGKLGGLLSGALGSIKL